MRELIAPAALAMAVAALLESLAVWLGWSPAFWVLAVVAGLASVTTFLIAGRLRALRLQARRRARRQTSRRAPAPVGARAVPRIAAETATGTTVDRGGRPPR